jgi:hypothetical protein
VKWGEGKWDEMEFVPTRVGNGRGCGRLPRVRELKNHASIFASAAPIRRKLPEPDGFTTVGRLHTSDGGEKWARNCSDGFTDAMEYDSIRSDISCAI